MDPVTTVIMIILFVLAGGGTGGAVYRARLKQKRLLLKDAIRARTQVEAGREVSIFDVFWDLGVSDYALQIMGNQHLLLDDIQDLPAARDALVDLVEIHGSYAAFVRENLETIQEFYNEHRRAGNRRAIPALTSRTRKTLMLPAPDTERSEDAAGSATLPVPYTGRHLPVIARDIDSRMAAREDGRSVMLLESDVQGLEIDVDEVTKIEPIKMLKSIFSGSITEELGRWWEMRTLRSLRAELDGHLTRFYEFYRDQATHNPQFFSHLYDSAERWDLEARRIDDLAEKRPWRHQSWEVCADVLVQEARATARQLSYVARTNVDATIEQIHEAARQGDTAMAGYLVYLNHHAFFAGRASQYSDYVRRIDTCTYRVQEEFRDLYSRGVV